MNSGIVMIRPGKQVTTKIWSVQPADGRKTIQLYLPLLRDHCRKYNIKLFLLCLFFVCSFFFHVIYMLLFFNTVEV